MCDYQKPPPILGQAVADRVAAAYTGPHPYRMDKRCPICECYKWFIFAMDQHGDPESWMCLACNEVLTPQGHPMRSVQPDW